MKKRKKVLLPGGIDNFHKLITHRDSEGNACIFVDKTLFIKSFIDSNDKITLITRPRRFGKTLTLSMLQHFLAAEVDGNETKGLFDGLAVSKHLETMRYQGQHPVIFVTLKDAKGKNFEDAFEEVKEALTKLFEAHRFLLESDKVSTTQKNTFNLYIKREATKAQYASSLEFLSRLMYQHTGKKIYILLDEYDTPINDAYVNDYYGECRSFLAAMFGKTFKGNASLNRGLITGILKVAKASIFSELNNLKVYTMTDDARYPHYFGFTEHETDAFLEKAGLPQKAHELKEMYNGYELEGYTLFNPFSIVSFTSELLLRGPSKMEEALKPYWINTGGTHLIGDLIKNNLDIKKDFTSLLKKKKIETPINENVTFNPNLKNNPVAFWSLLLLAGYVKSTKKEKDEFDTYIHTISFPNDEIRFSMRELLLNVSFGEQDTYTMITAMKNLAQGDIDDFVDFVGKYLRYSVSYFDGEKKEPEKPYHLLLLGMAAFFANTHHVRSERESGNGRYDIGLEPKDKQKKGIIIELKAAKEGENLKQEAQKAYDQILTREYKTEMESCGVEDFVLLGMAFRGKEIEVVTNRVRKNRNL